MNSSSEQDRIRALPDVANAHILDRSAYIPGLENRASMQNVGTLLPGEVMHIRSLV